MLTRPERLADLACVLLALAALCVGCASPRVPAELPHYPCSDGKGGWVECDVHEWLSQQGSGK